MKFYNLESTAKHTCSRLNMKKCYMYDCYVIISMSDSGHARRKPPTGHSAENETLSVLR